ncbi:hypothetical protein KSX_24110 [Ktedonospora formicarum]|uniref:non-specific serine/threonine protein kinase n=2 Tax=Ktedonospora formicarum TaxID=2778364 RepID=A0A8J3MS50_9CHLR|nr:hypothetical protein KSX_24110 [Ktedonospora formicarum]
MGAVYQARDLKRQAVCAIKEMSLSTVPPEEQTQAIQNFKIEAKILWRLDHPNLPKFTGFFSENQRHFLVMEYIDGTTLEELLQRNDSPFSERRVLGWARQLCDVLEYLHSQDPPIIFRDMKPGNAMLTRDGRIKLIDFGIARFFQRSRQQDTQQLGTPGFAPPEQYGDAQTDERSDIYSLAMTLFELLTNTLSEKGFGLKNIRQSHPYISPGVARALEIATSIDPDDRYSNVAEFRSALIGEHTFSFESSEQATTPEELAELCIQYPDEAADYLANGELESWLREIGEQDLAREARQIRAFVLDPLESVEQFIQKVPGTHGSVFEALDHPDIQPRNKRKFTSSTAKHSATTPPIDSYQEEHKPKHQTKTSNKPISTSGRATPANRTQNKRKDIGWLRWNAPDFEVNPTKLDFGEVTGDISEPLELKISSTSGDPIQGTLQTSEPWIVLDQEEFDGDTTYINVQINSDLLYGGRYTGTITITPHGKGTPGSRNYSQVLVEADIPGYMPEIRHGGKTRGADLDEDDEEEYTYMVKDASTWRHVSSSQKAIPRTPKSTVQRASAPSRAPRSQPQIQTHARDLTDESLKSDEAALERFGDPTDPTYTGWKMVQTSQRQQIWLKHISTWIGAFMMGSIGYSIISSWLASFHIKTLSPSPWFVLFLAILLPTTAVGALITHWEWTWQREQILNRLGSGIGSVLIATAVLKILWQLVAHVASGGVQLLIMLAGASIAAILGTDEHMSEAMIDWVSWALDSMRRTVIGLLLLLGGMLGFLLTIEFSLSWFTLIGILSGLLVAANLIWRVHLIQQQYQPQEDT